MADNRTTWDKAQSVFKMVWPMLVVLVTIVVAWSTSSAAVSSNTRRIEELESRQEILVDIRLSVSEAQTDIRWLKEWATNHPSSSSAAAP
jgi:hypothetical protein